MKRTILVNSLAMFTCAFLLVLFSPGAACVAQQTTFRIRIPDRDPQLPIAQVRIELAVTVVPGDADTLTVKHASLPPAGVDVPLNGAPVDLPGRNEVLAQAGTNRVVIILRPLENLRVDPGNPLLTQLCVKNNVGVVPDPDIWDFEYNHPTNSATGYRFNSYTALSAVECSCTVRRLGNADEPAQLTNMVPVSAPNLGRLAIDLMLVLDKSGSMLSPIPASVVRKTDALRPAVGQAISVLQSDGGPPRDRLLVAYFEDAITDSGLVLRGADATASWDPLKPTVADDPTSPFPGTAMGDGITRAIDRWQDAGIADPLAQNEAVIILLTDGMQNQGNLIKRGDALMPPLVGLEADKHHYFNANLGAYTSLRGQCIPVQSVGIGLSGAPYVTLLNKISEETGGTTGVTLGAAMDTTLMNAAIASLKGNTLTKVAEVDTSIASGTASNPPATFELGSSVKRVIVGLSWLGAPSGLNLQINRPGGGAPPIAQRYDDPNYTVQSVDLPAGGPPGQWSATVSRTGGNTATTPYHLTVIAVEGRLSFQVGFSRNDYGTGEPIVLNAALSDNGAAITGLGNSITVRVERPESALGSLLRATLVDPSVLTTNPPGSSPDAFPDAYARKLFHLMQNPSFLARTQPKLDPRTFTLFDDGNADHGDARAGDGIYSMKLAEADTRLPGPYRFKLAMDFDRVSTGRISRVETHEIEVRVKVADPNETEIAATKALASGEYRIDVVPADRFTNFLGPGFADRVKLTISGGGSVAGPPVDERENGTYTFRIMGVPSGADPTLTLIVNNQTVTSGTLSSFSKPSKRFAFFGGIGGNLPHGDFETFFEPGLSTQLGFEYRFTNRISAEGTVGYDRFQSAFVPAHSSLTRASGNLKAYPVIGTFQFGIFGGGGVYHFNNGGGTHGGLNIGAVSEFRINTTTSVEATYNFHNVFTSGSSTRFSTVQGGVRFRF